MKILYNVILLIIIFIMVGCKEQKNSVNIPNSASVLEVSSKSQADSLISPMRLLFHKNKLIVYDAVLNGSYLKFFVFNDNLEYLYSFGERGRAANEFGNIFFNNIISSDFIEVVDFGDMSIKSIDFNDDGAKVCNKQRVPPSVDNAPVNSINKIKEGVYFSNCMANTNNGYEMLKFEIKQDGRLINMSPLSQVPKWYEGDLNQRFTFFAYNNYKESNSNDKIGVFYYNYPYFRIIDTNGDLISEKEILKDNKSIKEKEKVYFFNSYATKKYIYSIWGDCSEDALKCNKVVAIDWDGNIKALYELNENASKNFAVSDDDEFLYSISNEENPSLIKYRLPK